MLNFFTDPHLGLAARTNTSSTSTKRLDGQLMQSALSCCKYKTNVVCAGDLFHRSHNSESVISQGMAIANMCDIVVGGNHDDTNRDDKLSSLDILNEVCDSVLMSATGGITIYPDLEFESGEKLTVIPHHASQDLFNQAVVKACEYSGDIVVLHCNFNNPFTDDIDTALNLTTEYASELLNHYKFIVIGHEHNHRWEMNGRLLALGNTHPTSFSDLSDKYSWEYENGEWKKTLVWSKAEHYLTVAASELIECDVEPDNSIQFVDITGDLDADLMPELADKIAQIWEKWNPFMVRNQVGVVKEQTESLMEEGYKIEDFSSKIKDGLSSAPELLAKFNKLEAEVGDA